MALLKGAGGEALAGAVGPVTIRSQLLPEIRVSPFAPDEPSEQPASGLGRWALRLLRPEVEVELAGGAVSFAPAGKPSRSLGGALLIGLGLSLFSGLSLVAASGARRGPWCSLGASLAAGAAGVGTFAWVAARGGES